MIHETDHRAGAWLFRRPAAFERGVAKPEDLPPADRVEVAFAGRSNVGKSSLLNALTGRRALARVSHTPGRTRELNFFRVPDEGVGLFLVDLPGYGHAEAQAHHGMERAPARLFARPRHIAPRAPSRRRAPRAEALRQGVHVGLRRERRLLSGRAHQMR
ncbi:MAG: GTPase [Alphaproteobacteria bacterium]